MRERERERERDRQTERQADRETDSQRERKKDRQTDRGRERGKVSAFKAGQSQSIISGLMDTFMMRHIVERTNKAEIRPEEQSEKVESCRENLWDKIQL